MRLLRTQCVWQRAALVSVAATHMCSKSQTAVCRASEVVCWNNYSLNWFVGQQMSADEVNPDHAVQWASYLRDVFSTLSHWFLIIFPNELRQRDSGVLWLGFVFLLFFPPPPAHLTVSLSFPDGQLPSIVTWVCVHGRSVYCYLRAAILNHTGFLSCMNRYLFHFSLLRGQPSSAAVIFTSSAFTSFSRVVNPYQWMCINIAYSHGQISRLPNIVGDSCCRGSAVCYSKQFFS